MPVSVSKSNAAWQLIDAISYLPDLTLSQLQPLCTKSLNRRNHVFLCINLVLTLHHVNNYPPNFTHCVLMGAHVGRFFQCDATRSLVVGELDLQMYIHYWHILIDSFPSDCNEIRSNQLMQLQSWSRIESVTVSVLLCTAFLQVKLLRACLQTDLRGLDL